MPSAWWAPPGALRCRLVPGCVFLGRRRGVRARRRLRLGAEPGGPEVRVGVLDRFRRPGGDQAADRRGVRGGVRARPGRGGHRGDRLRAARGPGGAGLRRGRRGCGGRLLRGGGRSLAARHRPGTPPRRAGSACAWRASSAARRDSSAWRAASARRRLRHAARPRACRAAIAAWRVASARRSASSALRASCGAARGVGLPACLRLPGDRPRPAGQRSRPAALLRLACGFGLPGFLGLAGAASA